MTSLPWMRGFEGYVTTSHSNEKRDEEGRGPKNDVTSYLDLDEHKT